MSESALSVRKRSGQVVDYQRQKITQAVLLCLVNDCARKHDEATKALAAKVTGRVEKLVKKMSGPVDVETIQDLVEQALLVLGERDAARQYILYRDERAKLRAAASVSPEEAAAIASDAQYFPTELSRFQHYNKYARFLPELQRRETVVATVKRDMDFFQWHLARHQMPLLTAAEYDMLSQAILQAEAAPSMRLMQMAGPAAMRCNAHCYNCCAAAITDFDYMAEILYLSMCGTGNGFSCENQFIQQLPQIKLRRTQAKPDTFRVPDTTEGWCDSVKLLAYRLADGHDVAMVYDDIRPAGTRLQTKGGTASGAGVLRELHEAMRRLFWAQEGLRLRDIDVHDIMCYIGKVGQLGNVRRGAEISLSDLNSKLMAEAKTGYFWRDPLLAQRTIANNSAVYNHKPSPEVFMAEWLQLVKSKAGERGIFNRGSIWTQIPERRRQVYQGADERIPWLLNPCFAAGTMVHTRQGHFPIETLVGKTVEIWDGDEWRTIDNFRVTGTDQSLVKVTMTDGAAMHCTPYHKFILTDGTRVEAQTLQAGNQLQAAAAPVVPGSTVKHCSREVASVEPAGVADKVYCCTVPGSHRFALSNGLLVGQCGEVYLYPAQMCNLSQGICRPTDTLESLLRKVELATIFGTIQSTMTDFNYLRPVWKENCDRERLLGVDLGGAADCPLLQHSNPDQAKILAKLRDHVIKTNRTWAKRLGINPSTAATVIKPGGNSGARWNVGQSMSGWLSQFMIRFVEVSNLDPMCKFLKDAGVYHEICYRDPNTTVFGFPLEAPAGAQIVADLVVDGSGQVIETKPRRSALDQLENWLAFKQNYTEHNPSITVYVADHEWLQVGSWVYDHWDDVGGLAFLPLDGHIYPQAPFTPVTEKAYREFVARFPERIPWEKLSRYEDGRDHRDGEAACSSDKCVFNPARR